MEDYIASCKIIDSGIIVSYPENIFTQKPPLEVTYKIKKEGIMANNRYIPCQNFCKRSLIAVDILIKLEHRNLTVESLYNNDKPVYSFLSLMSKVEANLSKEEKLKEIELAKVCLDPKIEICKELESGYSLILDLFACEGVKC